MLSANGRTSGTSRLAASKIARMRCVLLITTALVVACSSTAPNPVNDPDQPAIEAAVLETYNAISGPAGARDWDHLTSLFAPGARLMVMRKTGVGVMTPDEYMARVKPYFEKSGFFERPASNRIEHFRDIAQVFSVYESRHAASDAEPFARGTNSFQLVRIDGKWRVQSILWQEAEAPSPR